MKTAFIVTAGDRSREIVKHLTDQHDHASLLGPIAAEVAFTEGDTWLDAVVGQLQLNRTQLASDLATQLPEVHWIPPQATYLAWLDCTRLGLGDEPASAFLKHGRVALGRGLDYGQPGAGHVRLTSQRVQNISAMPSAGWLAMSRANDATPLLLDAAATPSDG